MHRPPHLPKQLKLFAIRLRIVFLGSVPLCECGMSYSTSLLSYSRSHIVVLYSLGAFHSAGVANVLLMCC